MKPLEFEYILIKIDGNLKEFVIFGLKKSNESENILLVVCAVHTIMFFI